MSRFDAVIFDMDGVIVDSEPIHQLSFQQLWREMGHGKNHGIPFPNFMAKQIVRFGRHSSTSTNPYNRLRN